MPCGHGGEDLKIIARLSKLPNAQERILQCAAHKITQDNVSAQVLMCSCNTLIIVKDEEL